jgi:hypothetical protein
MQPALFAAASAGDCDFGAGAAAARQKIASNRKQELLF